MQTILFMAEPSIRSAKRGRICKSVPMLSHGSACRRMPGSQHSLAWSVELATHQNAAQNHQRLQFNIELVDAHEPQCAIELFCVQTGVALEGNYAGCASSGLA